MKQPLVSVIIPVYNVENYLRQCVDSVLTQSYQNIEVILVDDGATDQSGEICDEFKLNDSRVKVIHKINGGQSDARNVGLENSTGDLVIYIDSDDFWVDKSVLGNIVHLFISQEKTIDFLIFNYNQYYQLSDKVSKNISFPSSILNACSKVDRFEGFARLGSFPMSAWTKLINRKFLIDNNIQFIKGIIAEDIPWFIELVSNSRDFLVVNEYAVNYRKQVQGAITTGFSYKKFDDLIFVVEHCLNNVKAKKYDDRLTESIYTFMAYEYAILIASYANVDKTRKKKYKDWFKQYSWLMRYSNNWKNKLTKCSLNIFGLELTSSLLRFYIRKFVNKNQ